MYLVKIVELSRTEALFARPRHPYTEALVSAVPISNPDYDVDRILLEGGVPSPIAPPPGCAFHPRCQYADEIRSQGEPEYRDVGGLHVVSCHFADELNLRAVYDGESAENPDATSGTGQSAEPQP